MAQTGEQDQLNDPPASASDIDRTDDFVKGLQKMGFQYITSYYEEHGGLLGVWDFLIGFKDKSMKQYWYSNEAEIEMRMKEREVATTSGKLPFRYFDGATMAAYEHPSKVEQETCCRNKPPPPLCDQDRDSVDSLTNAFPEEAPVLTEASAFGILFMPSTHALIQNMTARDYSGLLQPLAAYESGYGTVSNFFGAAAIVADSAFPVNGGEKEIRRALDVSNPVENYVFNPFIERNYMRYLSTYGFENKNVE